MPILPTGIVPILQTPFLDSGGVDERSFERLVEDAMAAGAAGLVYPAVASEVDSLSTEERHDLVGRLISIVADRVPVIAGVSSGTIAESSRLAEDAAELGAAGLLIQPPPRALETDDSLIAGLRQVTRQTDLPVILQDLDWSGPGMAIETILKTTEAVPTVGGIKVETQPAGPKYSTIRNASDRQLHISGGWAVTEMIDGLDRGVDAFMPEASMVGIYRAIWDTYHAGDVRGASEIFARLAPILSFSNQHIDHSIRFFKTVLKARGVFATTVCRERVREWGAKETAEADHFANEVVHLHARLDR